MQGKQIAIAALEGMKLLESIGMPRELTQRVESFELVAGSAVEPMRLRVTFYVLDADIPAIGSVFAEYELVRKEA